MRSMTAAFPGPETSRLTSGVTHPHPVKGGIVVHQGNHARSGPSALV